MSSILPQFTSHDFFDASGQPTHSHGGACSCGACLAKSREDTGRLSAANFSSDGTKLQEDFTLQNSAFQWQQPGGKGTPITLTYSYTNLFDGRIKGGITGAEMKSAIQEAFALWAKYAPINFVEIKDKGPKSINNPDGADIRFSHANLDGEGGTLGRANLRYDGELATNVVFDNQDAWETDRTATAQDLLLVAVHEIGHVLGLGHESNQDAIMRPTADDVYSGLGSAFLYKDDIDGIRALFGVGTGSNTPLVEGATPAPAAPAPTPPAAPVPTPEPPTQGKQVLGTGGSDSLRGDERDQVFHALGGNDAIRAGSGNDKLYGGRGSDLLFGEFGDDRLAGVNPYLTQPGSNERDILIGGGGADLFVLGDTRGVYYDDGQADTSGLADYAIIGDLNQAKGDKIQLLGNADSYRLGSTPSSTTSGTAIFLKTSVQDELIAIVKGDSNLSLQSSVFQFV